LSLPSTPPSSPEGPSPPVVSLWQRWRTRRLLLLTLLLLVADMAAQVVTFLATGRLFWAAGAGAVWTVLLAWLVTSMGGDSFAATFALAPLTRRRAACVALATVGAFYPITLLAGWSASLHPPDDTWLAMIRDQLPRTTAGTVVTFVIVAGLAPVAEEFIFRGLLFRICRRWWNGIAAAMVSGLVFGLAHGEPWFLFGLATLGLLLGIVFELTGTLAAPLLMHAIHNGISIVLMFRSGLPEGPFEAPEVTWPILLASLAVLAAGLALLRRDAPAVPFPDA